MNPFFHTVFSISDSLKTVLKSVLIYETIIQLYMKFTICFFLRPTSRRHFSHIVRI